MRRCLLFLMIMTYNLVYTYQSILIIDPFFFTFCMNKPVESLYDDETRVVYWLLMLNLGVLITLGVKALDAASLEKFH